MMRVDHDLHGNLAVGETCQWWRAEAGEPFWSVLSSSGHGITHPETNTGWWFQTFFIFTPTWGRFPF